LKLKKLLSECWDEEKQQCCHTVKANNPKPNNMKKGIYKKLFGLSVKNLFP
jgi:hypothetical protein